MVEIKSPCIKICRSDANGVCFGCRRTREEIGNWSHYSNEQKKEVLKKASNRRNTADTDTGIFFR
ncbi:MAG: DUF1289 domain-containing protein [Marinifilaceae bacterium]